MGYLSNNLPPGVTDEQLERLAIPDPECCGEVMELWDVTKYGEVFKCQICGRIESPEPETEL